MDFSNLRNAFFKLLKNIYCMSLVSLIVWMTFIDESSLVKRNKLSNDIKKMNEQISNLEKQIQEDQERIDLLRNNNEALEKLAREEYFMRSKNEVIFMIKE